MQTTISFCRSLPLAGEFDVIVAGGGPSGCAAAVAASRLGARVLLIEGTFMLGGMGTAGMVPAWCPFSDKEKIIYKGIAEEVFRASWTEITHPDPNCYDWVPVDAEQLKFVYDEMTGKAGVNLLFGVQFAAVEMRDSRTVDAIITSSKQGLQAWRARVYVDCTGDGDLAARAGAGFELADKPQLATLCFLLSGVNSEAYRKGPWLHNHNPDSPIHKIVASDRYPLIRDPHFCQCLTAEGTVGFNAGHLDPVSSLSDASLSNAMRQGRKMAREYLRALRTECPDRFGHAELVATASLPGIREGRRIECEYRVTVDDYLARRSFPDEIGRNCYYIDVHGTPETEKIKRYERGESHGIPYRCLVPRALDNVLVAGRSVSSDRYANGSLRVMPVCLVTGQAAGTAAKLLADNGGTARELDTGKLRAVLRENGAYFL